MEKERRGEQLGPPEVPKKRVQLKAIRNSYADMGVEAFYKSQGSVYTNPHFPYISTLLRNNESRIDYSNILDFCCGSGEVSQVLLELGYEYSEGSDPFTQKAYVAAMNKACLGYSFQDVIKGKMDGRRYSSIICSFAMHLCPEKKLYPLIQQLFNCTDQLVLLTPHKRPKLDVVDGVVLEFEDFTLTERGKKVRLRSYRRS